MDTIYWRLRVIVIAICLGLIVLIGPSRVFLGEHRAGDVVGSYIIGTIWLFIMILAYQWSVVVNIVSLSKSPLSSRLK